MPGHPIAVQWQIATDERMERIVERGAVLAVPELGHSVHVEVEGLEPSRWYWYRFRVGNEASPVGRTQHGASRRIGRGPEVRVRLLPALCERVLLRAQASGRGEPRLRRAPRRLHLRRARDQCGRPPAPAGPRDHVDRGLPDPLRAVQVRPGSAGGACALPVDHDLGRSRDRERLRRVHPGERRRPRRQPARLRLAPRRAYQAYYEHMPLRAAQVPTGPYLQLYRQLEFGELLSVQVLDTRQYRSHRAPATCALAERVDGYCPTALDPSRTIEGDAQQAWLIDGLARRRRGGTCSRTRCRSRPTTPTPIR